MIKDLYWLLILLILGFLIYYSNTNNNINMSFKEGYKHSVINIGAPSISSTHFLNSGETPFGLSSIYEVGKLYNPLSKKSDNSYYYGYYPSKEYY
jgi:hypothetical protein